MCISTDAREEFYKAFIKKILKLKLNYVYLCLMKVNRFPEKKYSGSLKNMAAGLSLLSTNEPLELFNLPLMKNFNGVAELILNPTDGVLQKTGKDDKHYTWWRTKQFNINSAKMIKNGNADNN